MPRLDAQTHSGEQVSGSRSSLPDPVAHARHPSLSETGNLRNPARVRTNNFVHSEARFRAAPGRTRRSRSCACCGSAVRAPCARLEARARAPRPRIHTRQGAGAGSDPQTAGREQGRTYMIMTHALGWALVDSLWQDALAAAGLAALLALIPVRAARARYTLATFTLGLMLALPLATAVQVSGASPWTSDAVTATSPAAPGPMSGPGPRAGPVAPTALAPVAARIRAAMEPALPWVVLVWFSGVVALSLRLASGWLVTRQLGSVGTSSVPDACREAVARLAARLRISRPVRVLESAVVQVPAVIGWLRPVILLPASALTGLTPLQLDALLAHELAHVRRYDYLVNLIQSVIETLLFYHPAVWWVSQQVRDEREHCCDDLAVAVCGDPHFYARALLGMERLRVTPPGFVLAAAGRGGSLMGRIRRLVAPVQTEIFPRWMAGVIAVALALGGGAHVARGTAAWVPSDGCMRTATFDSLIHRLETLRSPDARHEAVKTLGRRRDPRMVPPLLAIAQQDPNEEVRHEAVEALGKVRGSAGVGALIDIARTHPNPGVRRKAVKTVG